MVFDDSVEGRVRDLVVASGLIRLCITRSAQYRSIKANGPS